MINAERKAFSDLLKSVLEVYGTQLSAMAVSIWWASLLRFELAQIRAAFSAHVQSPAGRFSPKPADLISWLNEQDGHPGPEEAWSIVSATMNDEAVTVFWTAPMQAAFGVALGLRDDEIAARKAFLEVYGKALAAARLRGEEPVWQMSPGTDPGARDAAIEEAVRLGRLTAERAPVLLSHQNPPPAWLEHKLPALKPPDEET